MVLFLDFFDLLGPKILHMVEQSKIKGSISGALNFTFITLIPKCAKPTSFNDLDPFHSAI